MTTGETPEKIPEKQSLEPDVPAFTRGFVPQDMFEILMNGVFAFVLTLIVKNNIPLPSSIPAEDFDFIAKYVNQIFNESINFIFTFAIIAVFYLLFFEMLRWIRRLDLFFVCVSFGFILSIVFIPLSSLLWSFSDMPMPYGVLFHINILCCGLLMYLLWRHASSKPGLLQADTADNTIRSITLRILIFPATAGIGLAIDGWDGSFGSIPITELYLVPIVLFVILSTDP